MNTQLHAITNQNRRPLSFFMIAGQISDYTGAAALLDSLPMAQWMLADRGYDADWFRDALEEKGIRPCIPGRRSRGKPAKYDKRKYKCRNTLRQMSECLLLSHLPRCNRHVLAMSPEPSVAEGGAGLLPVWNLQWQARTVLWSWRDIGRAALVL